MPEATEGQEATNEATTTSAEVNNEAANEQPFDFGAWLNEQPEHVRAGFETQTAGLKSALESERQQRKDAISQLRDLSGKAEKGSEAEKALGEMTTRLELAEQRAAFFEDAGKPEIGCVNPKAAFLIASAEGLFTKRGEPDWAAIKANAPELFGRKPPPGNAGNGSSAPPPQGQSMNDFIRGAARGSGA